MLDQVTVPTWVSVKTETRTKLREIFLIPHSSHAQVITDQMGKSTLLSDGTTNEDLKALSVEKMQDYLGSVAADDTVHSLFKRCVDKVETPTQDSIVENPSTNLPSVPPTSEIKGDSKVENGVIKCEKCAFESKSKIGMRLHVGKKHK